jgi:UDP-galactose transporter B1
MPIISRALALSLLVLAGCASAERPGPAPKPLDRSVLLPRASTLASRHALVDRPLKPSLIAQKPSGFDAIPKSMAMFIGSAGIFLSFSVFAVLQEDVYKKAYNGNFFKSTFFCLVLERGINALVAFLGVLGLGTSGLTIPHSDIFNSGVSQMLAMAASNEALRYVSYPTQVLGKSCKMVPVMAGGMVISGKRYSAIEYAQVLLITIGVCVFNFGGKSKKGGSDSPLGLALIGASLLMDAFTGGLQDKVKVRTKELNPTVAGPKRPSMHESMLWTNVSGFIVALVLAILTGHLSSGLKFCSENPACLMAIVTFSLASAVGQNFVYFTLTQFNPLVLTTVTTTRKIFSTLYSVFRNPSNSLNTMQWSGTMMVFAGLLGDVARKTMKPKPKLQAAIPQSSNGSGKQVEDRE